MSCSADPDEGNVCSCSSVAPWASAAQYPEQGWNQQQEESEKAHKGDGADRSRRRRDDAAEPEGGSDQRADQKVESQSEHVSAVPVKVELRS